MPNGLAASHIETMWVYEALLVPHHWHGLRLTNFRSAFSELPRQGDR